MYTGKTLFAQRLITEARKLYAEENLGLDLANTVYALDFTTIDLYLSLFPWVPFRSTKSAVKMHTLLDLRGNIPSFIHISDGKVHDVNVLDLMIPKPAAIYIMDRAYDIFQCVVCCTLHRLVGSVPCALLQSGLWEYRGRINTLHNPTEIRAENINNDEPLQKDFRMKKRTLGKLGILSTALTMTSLSLIFFWGLTGKVLAEEHEWELTLRFPMVWAADVEGIIEISDLGLDASQTFKERLDTLTFGIMTEFYAQKGPWVYAFKLNYEASEDSFVSPEFSVPPGFVPIVPSHKIKTKVKQGTIDAVVGYEFDNGLLLYGGVKQLFNKVKMDIRPLGSGLIEIDGKLDVADEKLYDWLLGAQYRYNFTPQWQLVLRTDTAVTGDNDTDYSADFSLTYRISPLNNVWAGYRYLKVVNKTVEQGIEVNSNFETKGPLIGWTFTF